MHRFLFLLSWIDGSPSDDEGTCISSQEELMPAYLEGNPFVFAVEIQVPMGGNEEEIASKWGYTEAFHNNYTAEDSVSICESLSSDFQHPLPIKTIIANI